MGTLPTSLIHVEIKMLGKPRVASIAAPVLWCEEVTGLHSLPGMLDPPWHHVLAACQGTEHLITYEYVNNRLDFSWFGESGER